MCEYLKSNYSAYVHVAKEQVSRCSGMSLCVLGFGQKWSAGISYIRRWLQRKSLGLYIESIYC